MGKMLIHPVIIRIQWDKTLQFTQYPVKDSFKYIIMNEGITFNLNPSRLKILQ